MGNHITASVEFYFRGNKISSSLELELDQYLRSSGKLPDLYPLLAREINLSPYSYEYEIMQAETIMVSQASGLVADYVTDGFLDIDAFEAAWSENSVLEKLQEIAKQNLSIDDLQQHGELKKALVQAYQLGKASAN
ncbi:MAG: hypothetical protein LJE83_08410 [Gammaproteobacteria bacterium]|jgi:hypothetical protein|nr:hypothetical protein [Gammaproteobacteria bacterium]